LHQIRFSFNRKLSRTGIVGGLSGFYINNTGAMQNNPVNIAKTKS
jgi:hypothetical protein